MIGIDKQFTIRLVKHSPSKIEGQMRGDFPGRKNTKKILEAFDEGLINLDKSKLAECENGIAVIHLYFKSDGSVLPEIKSDGFTYE